MKIIFAPHADDEIIGCSLELDSDCVVIFTEKPEGERLEEAREAAKELGFRAIFYPPDGMDWTVLLGPRPDRDDIIFAPDPHWELHPDHRIAGMVALREARRHHLRFITYSTSMNAPYVRALPNESPKDWAMKKKNWLNKFYPSQADLWRYDHKYFLFEGLCEWNPLVLS